MSNLQMMEFLLVGVCPLGLGLGLLLGWATEMRGL
jgi:hypothetical protein